MDELRISVCEDDASERDKLLRLIETCGIPASCTLFSSGEAFLADYRVGKYDLIFMDIYMGGISGVETVTAVRQLDPNVPIAFCTTSMEHTLESYRLDVLMYLEKPVQIGAVREMLELARLKRDNRPCLHLRIDGQDESVPFERILYAEQRGRWLILSLTGAETVRASDHLDRVEPQFAGQHFFRCHKSYLVNLAYIKGIDRDLMVFTMKEGKNVHIRRESLCAARSAYEEYLFNSARDIGDA